MKDPTRMLSSFKGVIDSTLREGFQFSKADFTPDEQAEILGYLERIGVDYVEVGNPARPEIREMIEAAGGDAVQCVPRQSAVHLRVVAGKADEVVLHRAAVAVVRRHAGVAHGSVQFWRR